MCLKIVSNISHICQIVSGCLQLKATLDSKMMPRYVNYVTVWIEWRLQRGYLDFRTKVRSSICFTEKHAHCFLYIKMKPGVYSINRLYTFAIASHSCKCFSLCRVVTDCVVSIQLHLSPCACWRQVIYVYTLNKMSPKMEPWGTIVPKPLLFCVWYLSGCKLVISTPRGRKCALI